MKTSLTKNRMTQTQFSFMDNTKCRQIEPSIQPPLKVEPRPEVMAFARAMEEKLVETVGKDGWCGLESQQLAESMIHEVVELLKAIGYDKQKIRLMVEHATGSLDQHDFDSDPKLETVDVANFAMMIFDNLVNGRIACQTPPKS
jgi:hypothetical protein